MTRIRTALVLLGPLLAVLALMAQEKKPLTNNDVVQLVKAGLSESTILSAMEGAPSNFDVSAAALVELKQANVPEKVIQAMISAAKTSRPAAPAAPSPASDKAAAPSAPSRVTTAVASTADSDVAAPAEVGVYAMVAGKLTPVGTETVGWKTGGSLKKVATAGIAKGHVNGVIQNNASNLRVRVPLEFVVRTPEGVSAAEYQLLRMDVKDDRREFRALTGEVTNAADNRERDSITFQTEKVSARLFRIRLDRLARGEYGFLPPGAGNNLGAPAKIYTFAVIE
ncbi:MAG TPA: hypothetical protein VFA60_07245 [Terriglobales bacterium]|nr:hypothetical protein [Terriglobales bacterium]